MGKVDGGAIACHASIERNRGVYVASYEMIADEILERLLADIAAIPLQKFTQATLAGEDIPFVAKGVELFKAKPILY